MPSLGGTQPIEESGGSSPTDLANRLGKLARAFNQVLRGKINCTGDTRTLTFTAGATTTTLTDERIGPNSFIDLMPTTANAATAKQGWYVTTQLKGSAIMNHANSANVDQTFRFSILG